ncbi:MAG: EF2563 family selenium-dependent molybdenum hydroxylase system protein [Clostridiales Family XIII bacterium]|nr:EF2563 family selenium-dependent molybdenum hydroxylase system protein [Clostridiales Family XIII bacterium]
MFAHKLVIVKGAGDIASGVAWRLFRCGFPVVMTEIARPTAVRRHVAFAEAIYDGFARVENVRARRIPDPDEAEDVLHAGELPIIIDPSASIVERLKPQVVVDAIIAKRNLGTRITDAPLVIALGPGFTAGSDVHAVVETLRGARLGRVIREGSAEPDTAEPEPVAGFGAERVLRSPADGCIRTYYEIGDFVHRGVLLAEIMGQPVSAPFDGTIRGLLREGLVVHKGMKIGDVAPGVRRELCRQISDKALAVAGGVLEAILTEMAGGAK